MSEQYKSTFFLSDLSFFCEGCLQYVSEIKREKLVGGKSSKFPMMAILLDTHMLSKLFFFSFIWMFHNFEFKYDLKNEQFGFFYFIVVCSFSTL